MQRSLHTPHISPHRTASEYPSQELDTPLPRNKMDPDKHTHLPSAEYCLFQRGCLSDEMPRDHRNAPADANTDADAWGHRFEGRVSFPQDEDPRSQHSRPGEASHPFLRGRLSEQLRAALDEPCLFYPGAGMDVDPALLFTSTGVVSTVVYADYIYEPNPFVSKTLNMFEKGRLCVSEDMQRFCNPSRTLLDSGILTPGDFGFSSPIAFYPVTHARGSDRKANVSADSVIGTWALFEQSSIPSRPVLFLYFFTEAIQTYINLWGIRGAAPLAVVVQNHSKGGFWTRLDGDCLLYAASVGLPKYIYVGDIGSTPWPGYSQISRNRIDFNSDHHSHRALFESKSHFGINLNSPMHLWDGCKQNLEVPTHPEFKDLKLALPRCHRP